MLPTRALVRVGLYKRGHIAVECKVLCRLPAPVFPVLLVQDLPSLIGVHLLLADIRQNLDGLAQGRDRADQCLFALQLA